jgi:hypothetical protein
MTALGKVAGVAWVDLRRSNVRQYNLTGSPITVSVIVCICEKHAGLDAGYQFELLLVRRKKIMDFAHHPGNLNPASEAATTSAVSTTRRETKQLLEIRCTVASYRIPRPVAFHEAYGTLAEGRPE